MAKKKADLLEEAKALGLEVTSKNTVVELTALINEAAKAQAKLKDKAVEVKDAKTEDKPLAKAGKRSAKAVKEAEELQAKQERKEKRAEQELQPEEAPKKGPIPITRPRIERRSRNYRKSVEAIDRDKIYELKEAVSHALKTSTVKFDATVELHVRLNVDPRQADQNIRQIVILPHGSGKTIRVAVFAPADQQEAAKKAGADIVGEAELLELLKKEELNFDTLISTPQLMPQLGRYAKMLGPKGLMPNPKSGTVTQDVAGAVKEAKAGKVELRVDDQGIVHLGTGKVSFGDDKIVANIEAILQALKSAKPQSVKGPLVASISVTTSMGPAFKVKL